MRISARATTSWASTPRVPPEPSKPMLTKEFRGLCDRLKITDSGMAAELLGVSWRTCQRYWYGEQLAPGPLARLMRLAVKHGIDHKTLRSLAKPSTK